MNTPKELFANVRKSIRLLFEYQKRMQGTMFHIKSVLNLSPAGRIEVNKLFSRAPRVSKDYGETQLSDGNWAWDYLYPMAMEYYLGEKKIENYDFCLSVIQVTDDGYFRAKQKNLSPNRLDTYTFASAEDSDSIALFVMEIKPNKSSWAKRWQRDTMEENLNKWMSDSRTTIDDMTREGNHFIVMKFSLMDLLSDASIGNVLDKISQHVEELSGKAVV